MNRIGIAALILAAGAAAQAPIDDEAPSVIVDARTLPNLELAQRLRESGSFSPRASSFSAIYDTGEPIYDVTATGSFVGPGDGFALYDDITTLPVDGPVTIRAIKWGHWGPTAGPDHLYLGMEFFPVHVGTAAATNASPWSGSPITSVMADLGQGWSGTSDGASGFFVTWMPLEWLGLLDGITLPGGGTYGVRASIWGDVNGVRTPLTTHQVVSRSLLSCWPVGSSDPRRWFGVRTDAEKPGQMFNNAMYSTGSAASSRAMYLGLAIEEEGPANRPPSSAINLGVLPDGGLTVQGALGAGEVKWYRFSLAGDATDHVMQFLDIDSEGSKADLALILFSSSGVRLALDLDSGSGVQAQLSFGMGRRAAVGDGAQYDGRRWGAVPANRGIRAQDGPFYLAVVSDPVTFQNNFVRFEPPRSCGGGGSYIINLRTNTNGTPLAPSVPPIIDAPDNLGQVVGSRPIVSSSIPPAGVRWIRFSTCENADAERTLAISTTFATSNIGSATHAVFDPLGNLVASARTDARASPPTLNFGGTNPALHAGTYYLAQIVDLLSSSDGSPQFAPNPATQGRWHVRVLRPPTSSLFSSGTITASWTACTICHDDRCVADVDDGSATGTPDSGVTLDDLLFYLTRFAGGAACADIDDGSGTGTPDGGVTIDDLLYFLTRFEGGC